MRAILLSLLSFIVVNSSFSQLDGLHTSSKLHFRKDSLISLNYSMLPLSARYSNRYEILNNVNSDLSQVEINFILQNFLNNMNRSDSSLLNNFLLINQNMSPGQPLHSEVSQYGRINEKDMFYGVWRENITGSSSEDEIRKSVADGTGTLIDMGYSDLGNDFLPFITDLMEEHHMVNYDRTRTKVFGKGSKGIVTSVQMLNALGSQNTEINFGVCRDIHETGRELLKTMCEVYYDRFYPGNNIDFDDYIFLQSWTTDMSQHVTVSLIDPLNTRTVYELDWGRVIRRTGINGYDNGRMYGNTYRIWQYDRIKKLTEPVDFKRTQFGKILDEDVLTPEEYRQFNGLYDQEYYSNIRYVKNIGRHANLNFSAGAFYPDQKYFLATFRHQSTQKKLFSFLNHSNTFAIQLALHEGTRKKEFLYPETDWQLTMSLMGVPRIISKFETPAYRLSKNVTLKAFLNQQFDMFLIHSSFQVNDSVRGRYFPHSGDANLSFSNGFDIRYLSGNKSFTSSLTLQGRSFLLSNDIRLFSPNPLVLFSNSKLITPALDAISNTVINFNEKCRLSMKAMLEFTNLNAVLFSGSLAVETVLAGNVRFTTSIGRDARLKGIPYFWYAPEKSRLDLQARYLNNAFVISLVQIPEDRLSFNLSLRKYL